VASAVKTQAMPVRVVVREGETIKSALDRLQRHVKRLKNRPAHKHRYGYYEKPCELRRKRAKKESLMRENPLLLKPWAAQWARSGPCNSLQR
jgi:ribosomal protein S21